jgi:hypothetical protein
LSAGEATDSFTKSGAELLARTIRDYWSARGAAVQTRVVPLRTVAPGFDSAYVVRSDLVNGKPRDLYRDRVARLATAFHNDTLAVPHALDVFRL